MTIKDLKNKAESQLHSLLAEHRDKIRELRFKVSTGELKTVRKIRDAKKTVAKILTLLNRPNAQKKIEDKK